MRDPFYDPPAASGGGPAVAGADAAGGATRAVADPAGTAGASGASAVGTDAGSAKRPARAAKPVQPAEPAKPATPTKPATPPPTKPETPPPTTTTPMPTPSAAPLPTRSAAAPEFSYYRAVVGWGSAAPRTIARLTPLGGRYNPAAVYLGATKPGATYAIFVLGKHATSHGDGTCRTGTRCRMIALRPGDTRRFVVRSPGDGTVRRYTLRLRSLKSVQTTAAGARRARIRVHFDGRDVLRAMSRTPALAEVLAWASYDRSSGLLRPADVDKPAQ